MRCNECGYMNVEGTKVCAKCGTKLTAPSASSQPKNPTPPPPSAAKNEGSPTMRGKAASAPAWDEPAGAGATQQSDAGVTKCPECGFYPLKEAPAKGNPCPNCGYEGASTQAEKPKEAVERVEQASSAKTMKLGEMNIGEKTQVFKLKDEGAGRTIEFSGNTVELNRQNLDPSNNSLSGKTHAILKVDNGKVVLEDKSSNGATFVQVDQPLSIKSGTRIILGNKVYTVEFD